MSNALAMVFPTVAKQWDFDKNDPELSPDTVAGKSAVKIWWKCSAGHQWQEPVAQRTATPQWKRGDPAACRYCDPEMASEALVEYDYPCGHSGRIKQRNAQLKPERCWDCERPFYEERKRQERNARRRAKPARKPVPATPEQRAVQKSLVALLNPRMTVDLQGVTIYRDNGVMRIYDSASAEEIEANLATLGIPYDIWEVPPLLKGIGPAYEITIAWKHLDLLAHWAPSAASRATEIYSKMPPHPTKEQLEAHWKVRRALEERVSVSMSGGLVFKYPMRYQDEAPELADALEVLSVDFVVGLAVRSVAGGKQESFDIQIPKEKIDELKVWFPQLRLAP